MTTPLLTDVDLREQALHERNKKLSKLFDLLRPITSSDKPSEQQGNVTSSDVSESNKNKRKEPDTVATDQRRINPIIAIEDSDSVPDDPEVQADTSVSTDSSSGTESSKTSAQRDPADSSSTETSSDATEDEADQEEEELAAQRSDAPNTHDGSEPTKATEDLFEKILKNKKLTQYKIAMLVAFDLRGKRDSILWSRVRESVQFSGSPKRFTSDEDGIAMFRVVARTNRNQVYRVRLCEAAIAVMEAYMKRMEGKTLPPEVQKYLGLACQDPSDAAE